MKTYTYDPKLFNEGYYGKGERQGFRDGYLYDDPTQQEQLQLKWDVCQEIPHKCALFIGCARGYEVNYWQEKDIFAAGVDVSEWAINNSISPNCYLFDGSKLFHNTDSVDLVASFDVLTLVPDDMLLNLSKEIIRVSTRGIVFRTIIKNYRNLEDPIDGLDGVHYRYKTLEFWDKLFSECGKFSLLNVKIHHQYEATFKFVRS